MTVPDPDLNHIENEWSELKRSSINIDLGKKFCMEEWSLISCSRNSSGIIAEK